MTENAPKKPKGNNEKAMERFASANKEHCKKLQKLYNSNRQLNGANRNRTPKTQPLTPERIDQLINETFLRTVSRFPSPLERAKAQTDVRNAKNKIHAIKDLLWALLNTKEFLVNH